ncbi:MAG: cbb3-type cytochrome c oxidase subunit 3 [Nevskia sp.]|nr:cbb3-type cytochrome c oxidase subunit 3 [Nevskia sp.]
MIAGLFTLAAFLGFLGVAAWAYAPHNRKRFERAAQLPLDEQAPPRAAGEVLPPCCRGARK